MNRSGTGKAQRIGVDRQKVTRPKRGQEPKSGYTCFMPRSSRSGQSRGDPKAKPKSMATTHTPSGRCCGCCWETIDREDEKSWQG